MTGPPDASFPVGRRERRTKEEALEASLQHARESFAALREALPDAVLGLEEEKGEVTVRVTPSSVATVARFLKETREYAVIVDVTAVDYFDRDPRFEVVYHYLSLTQRSRLRVRAGLPEEPGRIPSITGVYEGANWLERETFDFFGIVFEGHPDLRRILNTDDFEGWPLRRDFPMIGRHAE